MISVPFLELDPDDYEPVTEVLKIRFSTMDAPLLPTIMDASKKYSAEVIAVNWDQLQGAGLPVDRDTFQQLVENSVMFMIVDRLALSEQPLFFHTDFHALKSFQTPETAHILGEIVNLSSREILAQIAITARDNQKKRLNFFAESQKAVYDEPTKETTEPDKGGQTYGDDKETAIPATEPDPLGGTDSNRQVRYAPGALSAGASTHPVHDSADQWDTEPAPDGDSGDRHADAGDHDAPAPTGGGRDGGTESPGSPPVGGPDEQPQAQRRGDDHPGTDYQLNLFGEPAQEPSVETPGSFAISQADIDHILRMGSITNGRKGKIYTFYLNNPTVKDARVYLKDEYGTSGQSHTFKNGSRGYISYAPSVGMKLSLFHSDAEVILRWSEVESRIRLMIRENTYLTPEEQMEYRRFQQAEMQRDTSKAPSIQNLFDHYKPIVVDAVLQDELYKLACHSSDQEIIHSECNAAIERAVLGREDLQLTKLYYDMTAFHNRLHREVLDETYPILAAPAPSEEPQNDPPPEEPLIETTIGNIPARDYYEIVAAQNGFDSYEDMKAQGIHIDGDPDYESPQEEAPDRTDEMLQQAMLASELYEQTGQAVIAFEEGNPLPVNMPPSIAPTPEPSKAVPARNFYITDSDLGCGSVRQKFADNLAAIRLLKTLESEDRNATWEEQTVLSKYVGWGGMQQAFDPENHAWDAEYAQLKNALEEFEYSAARSSVLNAHYTSPTVIGAIYEAVGNLGFTSGNILEPSCGVGNFFGLLPDTMQYSKLYGVELDSISGRIAKKLYPEAEITVDGFETTDRPNFYDLAIGNVPFGQYQVNDKAYNKLGFNIHNYFFAKAIDQVRPGGIVAFITSRYTMDAKGTEVRKYIAERAELLGAIRLPNNAFQANAGTSVVSDILFLQKRDRAIAVEPDWIHLGRTEDGVTLNSYFVDHPEMVLGEISTKSTQYGTEECTVLPIPGADLSQQLHEAVQHIHGQYLEAELDPEAEADDSIPADPNVKNYSFTLVDDRIYYRENSRMRPVAASKTGQRRIRSLIELRDCVRTLINYETEDYPESMIQAQMETLNGLYDSFQKKYGIINNQANRLAFSEDDSYYLLCSLEVLDDEQNFKCKADIFTKRTIRPRTEITKVETASEALVICLNDRARVDMDFMVQLTDKTQEELEQELTGQIFRLPSIDPKYTKFVLAEEYLSGNVREKLQEARTAAERNPIYAANVTALEAVQPQDLTAAEISVRLGSTWVPEEDIAQFIYDLLKPPLYLQDKICVSYSPYTGAWNISGKSVDGGSIYASSTYGTKLVNAYHIIEDSLNLRDTKVFDYVEVDGKRRQILNKKETAIAQGKQAEIKQAFQEWIWKDPERRERLTALYNKKFNNLRPREYDGSHLIFPGMNPEISLRPHQLNAIARALYGGNTLLAHCVGAGKTFEMVAISQESKRLGLCHKSMIVVPNHLLGQWASEYLQLYPTANILVSTEKDFTPARRKIFCSRIATGDYDAIIIGHSQFEKIPLSKERQVMMLEREIADIVAGIAEAKQSSGDNFSIKQMERAKKSAKTKLEKLNDQSRKDDVVTFEELGVDRLLVDEAHEFKNLAVITKMQNVAGISQTEAQKASDMFFKTQYMDEITDSHGVIFATGTPISNTMVEMFTMQRYLQYKTLDYYGLTHFDAWAANFGETVTAIELSPEGKGYRVKTRFARFYNLPELIFMFRMVADIQTADMLNLPVPEAHYHVIQLEPSEIQQQMVEAISDRADRVRNKMVDPKEDNMLKITSDGRKLALDQRLMNPMLPDDPNSKTATCAKYIYEIWQSTADNRGAQLVFCDLSTPHFDGSFNCYDDLRDKLTAMGIPKEEVMFIHEAPTDKKKKELFGKVRSGQVRVLIGSTAKMGTGTNVQTRLKGLHDIDCPWRPSDLEQRSGRIIRQGNTYKEVDIYRYVTKETFDAYLWQIIENKQKFISQIMTSKTPARTMEDVDETTLSYAEIKALATGNPLIKEKMDLDVTVARLTLLRSSFISQKYALEDQIRTHIPRKIREAEEQLKILEADAAQVNATAPVEQDGFLPIEFEGTIYTDKKEAGSALLEICAAKTTPEATPLGSYRGFSMALGFDSFDKKFVVTLKNKGKYTTTLGSDLYGNLQRIDNKLNGIETWAEETKKDIAAYHSELETAKEEVQKPFPREQEFQEKSARLQELNSLLNMDERDDTVLDEEVEEYNTKEQELCTAR